ncbi:MAG: hypothetical protein RLZZ360_460 [Candidatus Parcubacteria bacterium]|jgi:hypothetical protein
MSKVDTNTSNVLVTVNFITRSVTVHDEVVNLPIAQWSLRSMWHIINEIKAWYVKNHGGKLFFDNDFTNLHIHFIARHKLALMLACDWYYGQWYRGGTVLEFHDCKYCSIEYYPEPLFTAEGTWFSSVIVRLRQVLAGAWYLLDLYGEVALQRQGVDTERYKDPLQK